MQIHFDDGDSIATVVNTGVIGYTARLDLVNGESEIVSVVGGDTAVLLVAKSDKIGAPVAGTEWVVGYDDIHTLTIL